MQTLATSELVLEPLVTAHAEAMFDVLGNPAHYRYLDEAAPPSVDHLRRLYTRLEARLSPDGSQVWLNWVVRRPGLPLLGYVQATVMPNSTAWVGYVFSAQHWGRGYATQAGKALLEHLVSDYGVKRFLASVEMANLRSVRLLQRLGFHEASGPVREVHELSPTERLFMRSVQGCQ